MGSSSRLPGLLACLLAWGIDGSFFSASAETDGVLELDDGNWARLVESAAVAVVEFHAPWCEHCRRLAPEYVKAAAQVSAVRWGRVDATDAVGLATRFQVTGYPHVKLFRHGRFAGDYEGPNEAGPLARWARRKSEPSARPLEEWADARDFFADVGLERDVRVVGLFASNESAVARRYAAVAARADDDDRIALATTTRREFVVEAASQRAADSADGSGLAAFAEGDEEQGLIAVWAAFDEDRYAVMRVDAATTAVEMARFVDARAAPAVTAFESASQLALFREGPSVHALLLVDVAAPHFEAALAAFSQVAARRRERVRHIYVAASEQRVLSHFGFDKSELPRLVLTDLRGARGADDDALESADDPFGELARPPARPAETRCFRFEPETHGSLLSTADLLAFEDKLFAGELEPWLRSEPDAAEDDFRATSERGEVVQLTGRSFVRTVTNSRREPNDETDFFVAFSAPWCGHCAALAPAWEELAYSFRKVDSVVIAQMDATANEIDVDGVQIKGFPTLYFFPADADAAPQIYDRDRDAKSLAAFLKEKGTKAFDVGTLKGGGHLKDEL